jgi:hypothetical protein
VRALIVLESLLILGLSALILLRRAPEPEPDRFAAVRFLGDAVPGETATYRIDEGQGTVEFRVTRADRGGPLGPPKIEVDRAWRDASGAQVPEPQTAYTHFPHVHGLMPFLTPEDPGAVDRVWVLKRIRRVTVPWQGKALRCWQVDCIDPALPADGAAVDVLMHEDAPVYGVLRWERAGHVYELASWRPKS